MTPAEMGERATATAIAEAMLTTQLRLYPGQIMAVAAATAIQMICARLSTPQDAFPIPRRADRRQGC